VVAAVVRMKHELLELGVQVGVKQDLFPAQIILLYQVQQIKVMLVVPALLPMLAQEVVVLVLRDKIILPVQVAV
jgi:hypothetical protein